jgi:purine-binding chemotaxis protein CheW
MDITKVERIIEYIEPNPIPESSDYFLGVIQYNDKILPIINLGKRLYNVDNSYGVDDKVIVVMWKNNLLGLVVDEIFGIQGFDGNQIEDTSMDLNISTRYVKGFIKNEEEIIIVLDTDMMFNQEQENELFSSTEIKANAID